MSAFVESIELRVMSRYVVAKTTYPVPDRVIHALIGLPEIRISKIGLASARRLEFQVENWDYAAYWAVPIIVSGNLAARAPGVNGYDVEVVHTRQLRQYIWEPTGVIVRYPRFETAAEWAAAQHALFGRDWLFM